MLFNKAAVQPSAEAGESADKKGQTLKKYLHIWQLSFAGFEVFVTVFFLFLHRLYFAICRKNPPPPKQLETLTSEPARRLVYRSSGDSRYLVIH